LPTSLESNEDCKSSSISSMVSHPLPFTTAVFGAIVSSSKASVSWFFDDLLRVGLFSILAQNHEKFVFVIYLRNTSTNIALQF
jgi:hypothetical protein